MPAIIPAPARILVAASVTKLGSDSRDAVIVSGSHGGIYAAYLAAAAGARAVILNDAGIGLDNAGIAGLGWCDGFAMAAAAVDHRSAWIGRSEGMLEQGVVSAVNETAKAAGCRPGQACAEAARLLAVAPPPAAPPPAYAEARHLLGRYGALAAWAIDSAALVRPEDRGQIVVTGSHGGLVGAVPALALQVDARLALFNDAGIGLDEAGIGRLVPLQARGIAAATVDCRSARIGDGRSTYADGILSRVNEAAVALGARPGMRARDLIDRLLVSQGGPQP